MQVLTVCPGAIRTPFFDAEALERMPPVAKRSMVEPEGLVEAIFKALGDGKYELTYPRMIAAGVCHQGARAGVHAPQREAYDDRRRARTICEAHLKGFTAEARDARRDPCEGAATCPVVTNQKLDLGNSLRLKHDISAPPRLRGEHFLACA